MKIAVTSQNRKSITEHAGRRRRFWVFITESNNIVKKELLELPKEQSFHEGCLYEPYPLDDIDILIDGDMVQGLMLRLERRRFKGLETKEDDPEKAVLLYLNGSLETEQSNLHHHGRNKK